MIDLILLAFFSGLFFVGFWCGKKYSSISVMLKTWIEEVEKLFKS